MNSSIPSPRLRLCRNWALAATALLATLIAVLTLTPVVRPPEVLSGPDKLYHFIAFAALTLPGAMLYPRALVWLLPAILLLRSAIEIIQPWVGRSGELADFWADAVGVGAGLALGILVHRKLIFKR